MLHVPVPVPSDPKTTLKLMCIIAAVPTYPNQKACHRTCARQYFEVLILLLQSLVWLQIVPAVNATINALKAAGVVFVPFDSGSFTDVASIAWAGQAESDNYMEPETTARYLHAS